MYYIGLDVHKKTISYCVKDASGQVHQEGKVGATRWELDDWMKTLPQPWTVAMEATIFTGWIYDHLLPHAQQVKVAHPLMLRAIAAAKKKNDRIDAGKIAECLRCDFLPECHMASTAIRDRRRTLRYRHLLVRQMVQMKNRISGLLMETGQSHQLAQTHQFMKWFLGSAARVLRFRLVDHPAIRQCNLLQLRTRINRKRILGHRQHLAIPNRITESAIQRGLQRFTKRFWLARPAGYADEPVHNHTVLNNRFSRENAVRRDVKQTHRRPNDPLAGRRNGPHV